MLRLTDERAARRVRANPDDFALIYERHRARVYGQCRHLLRSPADADDATQAVFMNAFRALRRGNEPRVLTSWLGGIARNECMDRMRGRHEVLDLDGRELEIPDDGPDLDASLLAEADSLMVRSALARLPFSQRTVLHMRELDEMPYAEISDQLGLAPSAVETLLFRARGNLRDELLAARSPLDCVDARSVSKRLRAGAGVEAVQRKALRNHREACEECSALPVRRARTPKTAAALLVAELLGLGRKLAEAPAAQAFTANGPSGRTAAVLAVTVAATGAGVSAPVLDRHARDSHRAHRAQHAKGQSSSRAAPVAAVAAAGGPIRRVAATAPRPTNAAPRRRLAVHRARPASRPDRAPARDEEVREPFRREVRPAPMTRDRQPPAQRQPAAGGDGQAYRPRRQESRDSASQQPPSRFQTPAQLPGAGSYNPETQGDL